jgi:molybdate transport system regulatory protein
VFGQGKARLLAAVAEYGSLREAAARLKISYRKAWGDLRKVEACLGVALVERERGGLGGGRTRLTPSAQRLLAAYRRFRDGIEADLNRRFAVFLAEAFKKEPAAKP